MGRWSTKLGMYSCRRNNTCTLPELAYTSKAKTCSRVPLPTATLLGLADIAKRKLERQQLRAGAFHNMGLKNKHCLLPQQEALTAHAMMHNMVCACHDALSYADLECGGQCGMSSHECGHCHSSKR